nr:MAG TPA: hypothetical protein [Caudoviricetes sp.]
MIYLYVYCCILFVYFLRCRICVENTHSFSISVTGLKNVEN